MDALNKMVNFVALEALPGAKENRVDRTILVSGGGVVTQPANIDALRAAGRVVWLDVGVDTVLARTSGNEERPLLQTPDPRATVEALLSERRPLYEAAADERVDTEDLSSDEIAYGLAESARLWFGLG